MTPDEEARKVLDDLVRRHGRATVVAFVEWWLSRVVADTPARSRGHDVPPFTTPGVPTTRTRTECQRETRNR